MKDYGFVMRPGLCQGCGAGPHNEFQHAGYCRNTLAVEEWSAWNAGWNGVPVSIRQGTPQERAYRLGVIAQQEMLQKQGQLEALY